MASLDLDTLRAHNPVPDPDAAVEPVARAAALERALASALLPTPTPTPTAGRGRLVRWRRGRWPLVAIIGLLVLAAAALAASGILWGAPYDPPWAHRQPGADVGVPVAGGARLLSLRVPDPAGGPSWGLRVVRTTRGYECVQLGRVVEGRLGVLGQDGWFGGDHRFHPMPATVFNSGTCGLVGSGGYALTGTWESIFASGMDTVGSCRYPGPAFGERLPACPARDLRFVAYGLVGPGARMITYTRDGTRHTLPTVGPEGAYLLVRRESGLLTVNGSAGGGPGMAGGGGPGSFPGTTAVVYRDGHTCPSADPGPDACVVKNFTTTPVHVNLHLVRVGVVVHPGRAVLPGSFDATVRFRAPISVSSGALDYTFNAVNPGARNTIGGTLDRDVRQGHTVAWLVNIPACTRLARLTISLDRATATSQPSRFNEPQIATIGTVRVHLPAVRYVPWCRARTAPGR